MNPISTNKSSLVTKFYKQNFKLSTKTLLRIFLNIIYACKSVKIRTKKKNTKETSQKIVLTRKTYYSFCVPSHTVGSAVIFSLHPSYLLNPSLICGGRRAYLSSSVFRISEPAKQKVIRHNLMAQTKISLAKLKTKKSTTILAQNVIKQN